MKVIGVVILLIVAISSASEVILEESEGKIIFHANWLQNNQDIADHILRFKQLLLNSKSQIDLSFKYCSNSSFIINQILGNPLQAERVKINLDGCKVSDAGVKVLLGNLDSSILRSLSLNINSILATDQIGNVLGSQLAKFKLKHLQIFMAFGGITEKGLFDFLQYKISSDIESLSLDVSNNKLSFSAVKNINAYLSTADPLKLKQIWFNFNANKLGQNGASIIAESIVRFTELQSLKLDLYFNALNAKGCKAINSAVQQLLKLKMLTLNFDLNYIQTEGGQSIGRTISKLTQLQQLQIGVARKNFGFNGFASIMKAIQNIKQIKKLTLRCGVNRVGYKGAVLFAQTLAKLTQLQYLNVEFVQNFIGDDGMQIISDAIAASNVKLLHLNLGFNQGRNYGLVSVFKMLQKIKIKQIKLALSNNPFQDTQIKLILPFLNKMLNQCQTFQFQFLQTKISSTLADQLRALFNSKSQASGCKANIYVNSRQNVEQVREQLQKIHIQHHGMQIVQNQL